MNPGIFREYDIRGVAGKDILDEDVINIGKGYGTLLNNQNKNNVSIGRDCRQTSSRFSQLFIEGIVSTGCNVIDIGVCPTPVLYFSIHHLNLEGGGMITASHNPPEYNGFKLLSGTESIHSHGLQDIRRIVESKNFTAGRGEITRKDVIHSYKAYILNNINIKHTINIGIDAGNGTGGITAVSVLNDLGCNVHSIYCDMDGSFPNHEADPTQEKNLQDLMKLVKEKKLDLGVG